MKRGILFCLSCALVCLAGCSNPVKEELQKYIDVDLRKIIPLDAEVAAVYGKVSGDNYLSDEILYNTLNETVIPKEQELIQMVESLSMKYKTEEVRALSELYVEAAQNNNAGFLLLMAAMESEDTSKIAESDEKLDKARKLSRDWMASLKELCDKNGIDNKEIARVLKLSLKEYRKINAENTQEPVQPADTSEAAPVQPADTGEAAPVQPADTGEAAPIQPADTGGAAPVRPADTGEKVEIPQKEGRNGEPFVVVASSIKQDRANGKELAESTVAKLKDAGFSDAEVLDSRNYPNLKCCFWVVVAGAFATRDEAVELQGRVSAAGFQAYVKNAIEK